MKILVFYAQYGGGHLSAAKSVYEYISTNYPDNDVEITDFMKYVNKPIEKLTTLAYQEMAKKSPWAWAKIYDNSQKGLLSHISNGLNKLFSNKLLKLLNEKNPDLIISAHPFSSQMCSLLKKKGKIHAKIATIMTDFAPHDQWLVECQYADYFFVAHDEMKSYLMNKNIPADKIFVTGIPLSSRFLENFDKDEIRKSLGLTSDKPIVLFFAGGQFGLGKSKTLEIFECILNNFDNIQMVAIAGKNQEMEQQFKSLVKEKNKQDCIKVLPFTNKVPELMAISDLVITKPGGLTVTESLASELPIVVINPIPGQEEENAELLEKTGIAIWLKNDSNIYETFKNLFEDKNKLEEMKKNTSILANKYSTRDICEILLK